MRFEGNPGCLLFAFFFGLAAVICLMAIASELFK